MRNTLHPHHNWQLLKSRLLGVLEGLCFCSPPDNSGYVSRKGAYSPVSFPGWQVGAQPLRQPLSLLFKAQEMDLSEFWIHMDSREPQDE